ncbi:MAG: NUDIX hydrolase [Rhodoferax sp.]|nr:NUDIX hydrolase [Rhodoferax sp.]
MELNTETVNTPPRPAATIVLLRDAHAGLEVLLLKRHALSDVLAGAHVFPGGKVDPQDAAPALQALLQDSPADLQQRLQESALQPAAAAALHVAAIREAFEESGILLAQDASRQHVETARAWLREGVPFAEALARLQLRLPTRAVQPWSRWVTPRVPTVTNKRFDTRFFIAAVPPDQEAVHDNHEATEALWLQPREALERYRHHAIDLAPPQIMSLSLLTHFRDVAQALEHARAKTPPLVEPEPFLQDGVRFVAYPGDPRHSRPKRAFPGPTRLAFRDGRFEPPDGFDTLFDRAPGYFDDA